MSSKIIDISNTLNFISDYNSVGLTSSNNRLTLDNGGVFTIFNTTQSQSSSIAALILQNGGLSINVSSNATGYTTGGGITLNGGLAVSQDAYLGGILDIRSDSNNMNPIRLQSLQISSNYNNGASTVIQSGDFARTTTSFTPIAFSGWNDQANPKLIINASNITIPSGIGLTAINNSNTIGPLITIGDNIGINTTNPTSNLDVIGTIHASTSIRTPLLSVTNSTITNAVFTTISTGSIISRNVYVNNTNASLIVLSANETDNATLYLGTPYQGLESSGLKAAIIAQGKGYSTSNMHFCLDDTGSNSTAYNASLSNARMSILSNGNVGIATTNPSSKLDVAGAIFASSISSGSVQVNALSATSISVSNIIASTYTGDSISLSGSIVSRNISVKNTDASLIVATANESDKATLYLGTPNGGIESNGLKAAIIAQGKGYSRSNMHFCLDDTSENGTAYNAALSNARMSIISNGYVGVGTTNPGAMFDVAGTIFASSISTSSIQIATMTVGSLLATANISTDILNATNSTITNVVHTTLSTGTLTLSTMTSGSLLATTSISTGILLSTNQTTTNAMFTNLSTGILNTGNLTTGNINFTGVLSQNGLPYIGSQWTGTDATLYFGTSGSALVGINTTAPAFTLDINGSLRSTNALLTNATINNLMTNNLNLGVSSMFSGSFIASNNISVASNITGFAFANANIRAFNISISVSILVSSGTNLYAIYTLIGNQSDNGWTMLSENVGDNTGITFSITSAGQMQYTSSNVSDFTSSTFRYNVQQFTATGTYTSMLVTQGTYIVDSIQINSTQDVIPGTNNGSLYVLGGARVSRSLQVGGSIFNSAGNVGINTTSPASNLDVVGTIRASTSITTGTLFSTNQTTINAMFTNLSTGILNAGNLTTGNINFTGVLSQNGSPYIGSQWTGTAATLYFGTSGSAFVGIGTTSPQASLHVAGFTPTIPIGNGIFMGIDTLANTQIQLNSTSASYIDFSTSGTDWLSRIIYYNTSGSLSGSLNFHVASSTSIGMSLNSVGTLLISGDIGAFASISDRTLKTNVTDISPDTALQTVKTLRPVTFNWKDDIFNAARRGEFDSGFIAQEVEEVIPHAVGQYTTVDHKNTYKNMRHERIIPYLVGSIQKLEESITQLKERITFLESR